MFKMKKMCALRNLERETKTLSMFIFWVVRGTVTCFLLCVFLVFFFVFSKFHNIYDFKKKVTKYHLLNLMKNISQLSFHKWIPLLGIYPKDIIKDAKKKKKKCEIFTMMLFIIKKLGNNRELLNKGGAIQPTAGEL